MRYLTIVILDAIIFSYHKLLVYLLFTNILDLIKLNRSRSTLSKPIQITIAPAPKKASDEIEKLTR